MRNKRLFCFVLSIIAVITLFAGGCSSSTTSTSTASVATTSTTIINSSVFTTDLYNEPTTLDPANAAWIYEISPVKSLFTGLLGFNADLSLRAVGVTQIPTVANGDISADGLTYTFKLRPDATWSDGKPVTAQDYVYAIKRLFSPDLASPNAQFYFNIVGAQDYNGAADKDDATKAQLRDAVGVTAPDDYTLQIKLVQIQPSFLESLACNPVFPVREDIITKYGDKWAQPGNLIGNGPFVLTEWVPNDHITVKANPNYWGTDKAKVGQIIFKVISDANAALAAYKNNEIDLVRVPTGTEKTIMNDPTLSKQVVRYSDLMTIAMLFNVAKPPFDNPLVRQAFATAIDREGYVASVVHGVGTPAYSFIPPGMPGYDANIGTQYKFNATKAKQLLTDAGYADVSKLPPISFTYFNSAFDPIGAQFVQGQLMANLGINITLVPLDGHAAMQALMSGNYQITWAHWEPMWPDPDQELPIWATGLPAFGSYSNKDYNDLCNQALTESNDTKRLQLWDQAQQILINDAPVIPFYFEQRMWLLKPNVTGLTTTGLDSMVPGDFFFNNISVSK